MKKEGENAFRKPARHKKQNVFFRGEVLKLSSGRYPLVHFDAKRGNYRRDWNAAKETVLISLSDSDQFTTFDSDTIYSTFKPPYRMWPFLTLDGTVVWWVMDQRYCGADDDPMQSLRGLFPIEFKPLKG